MKNKFKYTFIEIAPMDIGDFIDIARLVDQINFLEEVTKMRKKYELLYKFPIQDTLEPDNFLRKRYSDPLIKAEFECDINRIRKSYSVPTHFNGVIEYAIIYGSVNNGIYSKAYLEEQPIEKSEDPYKIQEMKYSIVIHSGTRKKDVIKVLNEFKKKVYINFKGNQKGKDNYKYGYGIDLSLLPMPETHPSIVKLRNWYIRRMNGETPLQIALTEMKEKISYYQYKELKRSDKNPNKNSENEIYRKSRKITDIENTRDTIKTLIRRYRKIVSTP